MIGEIILLILAGLLGGFLAGLIGIGGGTIYIFVLPLLLTQLGIPDSELAQYTISNSLFAIIFASLSANIANIRKNNFYWREVGLIAIPCAAIAIAMMYLLVHSAWFSLTVFNTIVLVLFTYMFYNIMYAAKYEYDGPVPLIPAYILAITGVISGALSAVSGLGGGIVTVPILNGLCKVDIRKASSISLGVIMPTAILVAVTNLRAQPVHTAEWYSIGYIIFPLVAVLSVGVIITAPLGVWVAGKMPRKYINYIYAGFILLVVISKAKALLYP